MSFQERSPGVDLAAKEESPGSSFTGLVHRFRDKAEFLMVKRMEILSSVKNPLSEALNNLNLFLEEKCFNRLCGAPAHFLAGRS